MILRWVTAGGCFGAALLAVFPFDIDARAAGSIPELERAHQRHPRNSDIGLRLGLAYERTNSLQVAEHVLLEAARFDRLYQPAWTLANFYFRRGNRDAFWFWAQRAARVNEYDLRPILRLATAWESDPERLIARLGDQRQLLRPYMDQLVGEGRLDAASLVARHLRAHRNPADRAQLDDLDLRIIRSAPAR